MYFSLSTDGRDNLYLAKERGLNSHIGLGMGRAWDATEDDIDLPYRFKMRVVEGQNPQFYGWYPGSFLMQQALVDALRTSGVDNLQTFPTEIRREGTEDEVLGYVVVNIVGRVSCADMGSSQTSPLANVHYFHRLTIDPRKTRGLLMFRVDESPLLILVHEKVVAAIRNGSPNRQTFFPSYFTSNEYIMYSQAPLILLLITPSAAPASSPVAIMYFASLVMGILPSFFTEVGPDEVSDALPTLG